MEFKPMPEIKPMGKSQMQMTQKIHGSNAQVFIIPAESRNKTRTVYTENGYHNETYEDPNVLDVNGSLYELFCGSRTRWIYPGDDNFGFAAFVHAHKEEFIQKLGVGQHFGEWAGPGINSGEGLKVKTFVLFEYWKFPKERPLPPNCVPVPVLYEGPIDLAAIERVMEDLKINGSKLVPGFMRPEGAVIQAMGTRFKKVFKAEETSWKKPDENYKKSEKAPGIDYSHLLQPIRLEKLLSRDESYEVNYPCSLATIVADYFADLVKEGQVVGEPEQIIAIKKDSSGQMFKFVRQFMENREQMMEQL